VVVFRERSLLPFEGAEDCGALGAVAEPLLEFELELGLDSSVEVRDWACGRLCDGLRSELSADGRCRDGTVALSSGLEFNRSVDCSRSLAAAGGRFELSFRDDEDALLLGLVAELVPGVALAEGRLSSFEGRRCGWWWRFVGEVC